MGNVMGYDHVADAAKQAPTRLHAVPSGPVDRGDLERAVKRLIDERRDRGAHFAASLFSDPAWDILLVLTLAQSRYRRLTISNLCDAVDAPMTTALRWIGALTDKGLLVRRNDATDKRRKFVELSSEAFAAMAAYCSGVRGAMPIAA